MPISFDTKKSPLDRFFPIDDPVETSRYHSFLQDYYLGGGIGLAASSVPSPIFPIAIIVAGTALMAASCRSEKSRTISPNVIERNGGGRGPEEGPTRDTENPETTATGCANGEECFPTENSENTDNPEMPSETDPGTPEIEEETCHDLDERTSGSGAGECRPITEKCIQGEWVPLETRKVEKPVEISCDNLDNDCDGEIDDGFGETTCGIGACEKTVDNCLQGMAVFCDPLEGISEEHCHDQIDNNCDGNTDEESAIDAPTWYRDTDADTFGTSMEIIKQCLQPSGFVANSLDCNDNNPFLNPAASEACDGWDTNCTTPSGFADVATEIDNDGDGYVECEPFVDHGSGIVGGGDCDDIQNAIHPVAVEICDTIDNNCDALTDDPSAADAPTWYADADQDHYGNLETRQVACTPPEGMVSDNTDCNDLDSNEHPGQIWAPDQDGDLYGAASSPTAVISCTRPEGHVLNQTDCLDINFQVNPAAEEVCDGYDTDCSSGTSTPENESEIDNDSDGYVECEPFVDHGSGIVGGGDCDDTDQNISPVANELSCDGKDNNCNAETDEIDERVPEDFATIQSAIDASTTGAIVCVSPGIYNERIRFNGKAITVIGRDGSGETQMNGEAGGSVVTFANSEGRNSILNGFTITNGNAEQGGGIYINNADPTLTRLILSGNHASQYGGGISISSSDPVIKNVDIRSNSAVYRGGALYVANGSRPEIENIVCAGNTAQMGGGITFYAGVNAHLTNITLFKNQAEYGGALYLHYSTVYLDNAAIVSNTCTYSNYCQGEFDGASFAFIYNYSNLWGNLARNATISPSSNNISTDPLFVDTTSATPLLWDLHLYPTSPLINSGKPDIRNPDGTRSDIGAYGGPNANQ